MRLISKRRWAPMVFGAAWMSATSVWAREATTSSGHWWWQWFGGSAWDGPHTGGHKAVPEIDAGAGLLAGAAAFATLALVWEFRRRRDGSEMDQKRCEVTLTATPSSSTKQP